MPSTLDKADGLELLTKRERLIATRFAEGLTYKEIAEGLHLAPATVRSHLAAVYKKLGVTNKARLINLVSRSFSPAPPPVQMSLTAITATADAETPPPRFVGERRQLTVLVCALAGFSDLSVRLDPEQLRDLVATYYDACRPIIADFEGHSAQITDSRLQVYFGYPTAHEDDAERAVRAGLRLIDAIAKLDGAAGHPLALTVGIATGLAVIDNQPLQGRAAIGYAPALAGQLQALAEPGSVLVASATIRLLGQWFEYRDLGEQRLDGSSNPVAIYQVLGSRPQESRFDALHPRPLTPLVGRAEELEILCRRWSRARAGEGQAVLLGGEAGIGKSRIVQALRERIAPQPCTYLTYQCSPHYTSSALYPIIAQLQQAAQFNPSDTAPCKLDKLEALLRLSMKDIALVAPLFAALLSISAAERYPPLQLTPEAQREKTLTAVIDWIGDMAARQPLLLLVEDAHWSDPTTLELLGLILERLPQLPALLVLTFRPEFMPPWNSEAHISGLTLNRLSHDQMIAMVNRVSGGKRLPDEVLEQIAAKTDGVPLFIEELTKTILNSGWVCEQSDRYTLAGSLPSSAIPATLQDSLVARLDRLAAAKEVAQMGAVIGREFAAELLLSISGWTEPVLAVALQRLIDSGLVFRRGTPPVARYVFKHALIQDAAYQSLLNTRRQQLHARTAQVLEQRYPQRVEVEPELLARHYTEAGIAEQAVAYWVRAAHRATERSANSEIVEHANKGLRLLRRLPATVEHDRQRLDLWFALGVAYRALKGFDAPQTRRAFLRARALCKRAGDDATLILVLRGIYQTHFVRGEHRQEHGVAQQMLDLALRTEDEYLLGTAYVVIGIDRFHRGELAAARDALERGVGHAERGQPLVRAHYLLTDLRTAALMNLSQTLWTLGYPDQARDTGKQAIAAARISAQPLSLAAALMRLCSVHLWCKQTAVLQPLHHELTALAGKYGFVRFRDCAAYIEGKLLLAEKQTEAGLMRIRSALAALHKAQARRAWAWMAAEAVEDCLHVGEIGRGFELLNQAFENIDRNHERNWEAELYRLRGELLRVQSAMNEPEAEACFQRARSIAQHQCAKSLELRAAMSLARLWCDRGERDRARDLLGSVYPWFSEGFETADLTAARRFHGELATG